MRTTSFLLVAVVVIIYAIGVPATGRGESMGTQVWNATGANGWEPIKNINHKHIQELGDWAVLEYNKRVNCVLKFNKVVSGRQSLIFGMNYVLIIDVTHFDGKDGKYKAELHEQEFTEKRQLLSFMKVN
ncbi:hypothetical protein ACQJBY_011922 [Aegilops geniculata]